MAAGGRRPDPVKVVIINTQYIETDAVSFKSVVQSLTGQESAAPRIQAGAGVSYDASPVLSRGMSFKDFERMLKELPPLDELYEFFA
ncbi:VQ motif-containing protein 1-like [Sesamum indicum]|uniref:VQ motif-containing protein 1-like n=1 Tax=Sesamum indicum TaxID=4182 RepID=A0A6I9UHL2_SESIN|nr:VQ motif-containing protein 1-like [Sesamum indicum]